MIDERHEELAALYALDLLEGAERTGFEQALERDPALQALVRDLRHSAASLAHLESAHPPTALRARVLASIGGDHTQDNVVRVAPSFFRVALPWAVAAGLALGAVSLGQLYLTTRSENATLRDRGNLAEIAAQSVRQQLEAERIITRRQIDDLGQQASAATRDAGEARAQLASAATQLADRERQVATLTQRIDTLTGASAEIGRQLGEAKEQIAKLTAEMKTQGDIASLKITTLASMLDNSPQALAVAVWDPTKQDGLLKVQKLPALAANQDYQLWVVDAADPGTPVDGGVFTVDPATGEASFSFRPKRAISAAAAFAITRERKGGVIKSDGPILLLGK